MSNTIEPTGSLAQDTSYRQGWDFAAAALPTLDQDQRQQVARDWADEKARHPYDSRAARMVSGALARFAAEVTR